VAEVTGTPVTTAIAWEKCRTGTARKEKNRTLPNPNPNWVKERGKRKVSALRRTEPNPKSKREKK
jgi:hypothetical protein